MPPNKSSFNAPASFNASAHDLRLGVTQPGLTTAESGQQEPLLSQWCFRMLTKQIPVYIPGAKTTHRHMQKYRLTTYLHTLLLLGTSNYHKWQCIVGYLGTCFWGLECNSWWANRDLRGRTGSGVTPVHFKALPACLKRCLLPSCPVELSNAVVCRLSRR